MTREETIALWQQCESARRESLTQGRSATEAHSAARSTWMEWARPLAEKRGRLEGEGEWSAWSGVSGRLVGMNVETIAFLAEADAVFSTPENPFFFTEDAIFSGWIFPGRVEFNAAIFSASAQFNAVLFADAAEFREVLFGGTAEFERAVFLADSSFKGGHFSRVTFRTARFAGRVNLSATFQNDADCGNVQFEKPAEFGRAEFRRIAEFGGSEFREDASFAGTNFSSTAVFRQTTFRGYATFAGSRFEAGSNFQALRAERAFTLENSTFNLVPDFVQAHFKEAPRLDNSQFAKRPSRSGSERRDRTGGALEKDGNVNGKVTGPGADSSVFARPKVTSDEADAELPARFRALKRLAVSGHDTERELEFSAREILSRRGVEDHPFGENASRYWLGWLYEKSSDFGRSVMRPIRLWFLLNLLFAAIYLSPWSGRRVSLASVETCEQVPNLHTASRSPIRLGTNAALEALQLSFRNGTLVLGNADPNVDWRTLGCLYGSSEDNPSIRKMPRRAAVAAITQRTICTTLVVLIGMALRNILKMK